MCLIFIKFFNQWKTSLICDNTRFDDENITNHISDREDLRFQTLSLFKNRLIFQMFEKHLIRIKIIMIMTTIIKIFIMLFISLKLIYHDINWFRENNIDFFVERDDSCSIFQSFNPLYLIIRFEIFVSLKCFFEPFSINIRL